MKRSRMIPLVFGLVFVFGFYGVTFSGGWEDPVCQNLPAPTSGHFIRGDFSAAQDKSPCSADYPEDCAHYNVHLMLKRGKQVHMFSFSAPLGTGDLCGYKVKDTYQNLVPELKTMFAKYPCNLGVGRAFDLQGVPVIVD